MTAIPTTVVEFLLLGFLFLDFLFKSRDYYQQFCGTPGPTKADIFREVKAVKTAVLGNQTTLAEMKSRQQSVMHAVQSTVTNATIEQLFASLAEISLNLTVVSAEMKRLSDMYARVAPRRHSAHDGFK